jgi:hypothetical protein
MCYKQEQMALCVRYVKNLDVVEKFFGFIYYSKNQDAESLYHGTRKSVNLVLNHK